MNIKKLSKSSISIESSSEDAKIECLFYNGTIVSKLKLPSRVIEISKPGDYEYNHIGFTGFEVTNDGYKGIINLCKIIMEEIKIAIVFSDFEINKDVASELVNIDILITPYFSGNRLKEHISDIDPKSLILLEKFENSVEFNVEDIKKTLGVGQVVEATSYKFKSSDFPSSDEYTLTSHILK